MYYQRKENHLKYIEKYVIECMYIMWLKILNLQNKNNITINFNRLLDYQKYLQYLKKNRFKLTNNYYYFVLFSKILPTTRPTTYAAAVHMVVRYIT